MIHKTLWLHNSGSIRLSDEKFSRSKKLAGPPKQTICYDEPLATHATTKYSNAIGFPTNVLEIQQNLNAWQWTNCKLPLCSLSGKERPTLNLKFQINFQQFIWKYCLIHFLFLGEVRLCYRQHLVTFRTVWHLIWKLELEQIGRERWFDLETNIGTQYLRV